MKKILNKIILTLGAVAITFSTLSAEKIGEIKTSGIVFKDKLEILAFNDPGIKGVTCYVTSPKKSLSFEDPTDASISCRKTGEIKGVMRSGKRIFKNSKGLFVKSLYVDRIYDYKRKVLVYVSYTGKLSGTNANNSISVVRIKEGK